jgi:hypothetical protein
MGTSHMKVNVVIIFVSWITLIFGQNDDSIKTYYYDEVIASDSSFNYTSMLSQNNGLKVAIGENSGERMKYFTAGDQSYIGRTGRYYNQTVYGIKPHFFTPENIIVMPMIRVDGIAGVLNEEILTFSPALHLTSNSAFPPIELCPVTADQDKKFEVDFTTFGGSTLFSRTKENSWFKVGIRGQGPWQFTKGIIKELDYFSNQYDLTLAGGDKSNNDWEYSGLILMSTENRNHSGLDGIKGSDLGVTQSLGLKYKLGWSDLVLSNSWSRNKAKYQSDLSNFINYANEFLGLSASWNNIRLFSGLFSAGANIRKLTAQVNGDSRTNSVNELWLSYSVQCGNIADLTVYQRGIWAYLDKTNRFDWGIEIGKDFNSDLANIRLSAAYNKFYDSYILNNVDFNDVYKLEGLPIARIGNRVEFRFEATGKTGGLYLTGFYNKFGDLYYRPYSPKEYVYSGITSMLALNWSDFNFIGKCAMYPQAYINESWMPGALGYSQFVAASYNIGVTSVYLTYARISSVSDRYNNELIKYPSSDALNVGMAYNFQANDWSCQLSLKINYLNKLWGSSNYLFYQGQKKEIPLFPELGLKIVKY